MGVGAGQTQSLASVELKKVDGLSHIGIGLGPVLSHFIGEPSAEFKLALANDVGCAEQQGDARLDGRSAPEFESPQGRGHGFFGVLTACFLMDADDLRGLAGLRDLILPSVLRRSPPIMRSYSLPN